MPNERTGNPTPAPTRHDAPPRGEPPPRAAPFPPSADELGIFFLHAGQAIRAAVFGEPYDAQFECTPGDLAPSQPYPGPPETRDFDILFVTWDARAGTESTPPERRKIWVSGVVFPDGRSEWLHVYGSLDAYWGQPPPALDEAPSVLRRALLKQLDPATSMACHGAWDPTTPTRLCAIRDHGPEWEAKCVERLRSEQADSTASCAQLDPPVPGEKLAVAVGHINVSIGRNRKEEHILRSWFARADKGRLCLWKAGVAI